MFRAMRTALVPSIAILLLTGSCVAQQLAPQLQETAVTQIYFVRHGEVDDASPMIPLNVRGHERAAELVRVLERVHLTHVFSSHTLRARQTVTPAAVSKGLEVATLPPLGSEIAGQVIDGVSPSNLAVVPLAEALAALPVGSVALVGVNSDNLFGILNRLGVPLGTGTKPCELGRTCVPCLNASCFPPEFDNLWILLINGDSRVSELVWLKYGLQ